MIKKIPALATLCIAAALSAQSETVSGTITVSIDLSAQNPGEEAKLWLPYPISDAAQEITEISFDGNFSESAVQTDQQFKTPMLFAKWPASATNRNLTLTFTATRLEQHRPKFPSSEPEWNATDHALYLRPTRMAPLGEELRQLARQVTEGKSTVLDKARAIYDWTVENTWRNPETRGCGSGDLAVLLRQPCGKCADISSVFIALCRAADIPAREVLGIRMAREPLQDITTWQHCWAEFFLPGTGWVPVDPADVRKKMLVDDLQIDDPAIVTTREYFFGGLDAYRVKLGQGRDIHLNPEAAGGSVNYLMYPFAQVGAETLDWLEPEQFRYTITFTAKPDPSRKLAEK